MFLSEKSTGDSRSSVLRRTFCKVFLTRWLLKILDWVSARWRGVRQKYRMLDRSKLSGRVFDGNTSSAKGSKNGPCANFLNSLIGLVQALDTRQVTVLNLARQLMSKWQTVGYTEVEKFLADMVAIFGRYNSSWRYCKVTKIGPSASRRPGWASERWNALNVNKINPLPANSANPSNPSEEVNKCLFWENTNTEVKRKK